MCLIPSVLILLLCDRFWPDWVNSLVISEDLFSIRLQSFASIPNLYFLLVALDWRLDPLDGHIPLLTRIAVRSCCCVLLDMTELFFLVPFTTRLCFSVDQQHIMGKWWCLPTSLTMFKAVQSFAFAFGESLCSTFAWSFAFVALMPSCSIFSFAL